MGLFGKKKEEKSCCCGDSCTPEKMAQAEAAKTTAGVKVLGSGFAKCHALEDATRAALAELNHRPCDRLLADRRLWRDDHPCPCGRWQGRVLW